MTANLPLSGNNSVVLGKDTRVNCNGAMLPTLSKFSCRLEGQTIVRKHPPRQLSLQSLFYWLGRKILTIIAPITHWLKSAKYSWISIVIRICTEIKWFDPSETFRPSKKSTITNLQLLELSANSYNFAYLTMVNIPFKKSCKIRVVIRINTNIWSDRSLLVIHSTFPKNHQIHRQRFESSR